MSSLSIGTGISTSNQVNTAFDYTYNSLGYITNVKKNGTTIASYGYDSLGQLISESNAATGEIYIYTYDKAGNITKKDIYVGDIGNLTDTITYTYGNTAWKDRLTNYDGNAISYDSIGNPTNWVDISNLVWNGKVLDNITIEENHTVDYTYTSDGLRTRKYEYNGNEYYYYDHSYVLDGSKILKETILYSSAFNGNSTTTLEYYYDESGISSFRHNGAYYYYLKNLQGDVIGIIDNTGAVVVEYAYDAWGNILSVTGSLASTIGQANPFRYRSYYYDTETGLYYLNSRYYDPQVGRFINADGILGDASTAVGYNMFAYCSNNPVIREDNGGRFWDTVFDVVSLAFSVADVIANPEDPLAWIGLVGDAIDLVPFVTGVGETIKVVSAGLAIADTLHDIDRGTDAVGIIYDGYKAANNIDNTVDTIKTGWRVGDDVTNLTKAGNTPSWSTVRQRYWKNEAHFHPELYPNDLERMKKGLAPIGEDGFSMELHHPSGRDGNNFFDFEPLTQTQHRWIHYGN